MLGLVIGKPVGVYLFSVGALRAGWARLPEGLNQRYLLGAGAVAGIGFTVALFISDLAFGADPVVVEEAVIGILAASLAATFVGWLVLRSAAPGGSTTVTERPPVEAERADAVVEAH